MQTLPTTTDGKVPARTGCAGYSFSNLPAILFGLAIFANVANANSLQLRGNLNAEARYFTESTAHSTARQSNISLSLEPEFFYPFTQGNSSLSFTPFMRWDENDPARSHVDLRELNWHKIARSWELTLGIDTVFWGVTETIHLVNIINQVDLVENPDQEDLLGQPMLRFTSIHKQGTLDFFYMPYFRERNFAGRAGRPATAMPVNSSTLYESSAGEWHSDLALRWSHTLGSFDIGLAHFYGTSREPRLSAANTRLNARGEPTLVPLYEIINQSSLDLQATFGAWLLKLEAITRSGQQRRFFASAAGFEYSFYDIRSSGIDLGIVAEYLFDERDSSATNNDLALGLRLALNDVSSSELLAALAQDLDNGSQFFFVEASRRIGNHYKASLEARGIHNAARNDPLQQLDGENYLQLELARYF